MRGKSGVEIQAFRYVTCLRFHFIYGSSQYFSSHISISCRSFIYVSAYFITCSFPVLGLTLLTLFQLGQFGTERGGYLLTYCCLILQAGHISTVKVSGWRSAGHSGKCILLNCCFFPVLGLTLLTLLKPGQFGAERGGYLLTYCCLILQARRTVVE